MNISELHTGSQEPQVLRNLSPKDLSALSRLHSPGSGLSSVRTATSESLRLDSVPFPSRCGD